MTSNIGLVAGCSAVCSSSHRPQFWIENPNVGGAGMSSKPSAAGPPPRCGRPATRRAPPWRSCMSGPRSTTSVPRPVGLADVLAEVGHVAVPLRRWLSVTRVPDTHVRFSFNHIGHGRRQARPEGDSMGIVDGKIAIVTGSGRGVGRGEAMELAAQGAKVVVCDPGPSSKGEGTDNRPADETVEIIRGRGGEAVAAYEDISSWDGAERAVAGRGRHLRRARRRGQQRRHPPRRADHAHDRGRVGWRHRRAPQGHVQHDPPRVRVLVRRVQGRAPASRRRSSTRSARPACRATRVRPTTARPRPASPP